jgi:hypothetical protein
MPRRLLIALVTLAAALAVVPDALAARGTDEGSFVPTTNPSSWICIYLHRGERRSGTYRVTDATEQHAITAAVLPVAWMTTATGPPARSSGSVPSAVIGTSAALRTGASDRTMTLSLSCLIATECCPLLVPGDIVVSADRPESPEPTQLCNVSGGRRVRPGRRLRRPAGSGCTPAAPRRTPGRRAGRAQPTARVHVRHARQR